MLVSGLTGAEAADSVAGANAPAATTTTNAPAAQPYGKKEKTTFLHRLNEAVFEQNSSAVYTPPDTNAPPTPARRIGPAPFDGPPYPTPEWRLGGGPNIIGDPGALRDSPYPLMQALYDGPNAKWWYDSRIQFYGWETVGGNISSSGKSGYPAGAQTPGAPGSGQAVGGANFPEVYDERPDRLEQDQAVLYIERMADKNQTDHIDWGFRYSLVYGLDYRFMISRGFLSNQLLVRNDYAGVDMPMMYGNVYIPWVAQGMDVLVGCIISMPDIEQQLAPNNLMASHSITYGFDNYTMWGIWGSTKLSPNWTIQLGLADGVDIAPWQADPGRQPTGSVNIQWISSSGHDSAYVGMNSFNNGTFGYNKLQECIESYTHKFTEKAWTTFEFQYMYMENCTTTNTAQVPFQDGFYPTHPGYVYEGGLVNYTMFRIANNAFLTFRNEGYDDSAGARTGYATCYYETSVGVSWWLNKLVLIRPELRFEHSFNAAAYDFGTRHNQATLACDITYHF